MDRNRAADVSELHVEVVLLPVRIERLLVEPVRERREQWYAIESWPGAEILDGRKLHADDVLSLDDHLVGVADRVITDTVMSACSSRSCTMSAVCFAE